MILPYPKWYLAITVAISLFVVPANGDSLKLSPRVGPIPATTNGVPHVQIGVNADPEISAELLRQVSEIPGVEVRETVISLPGAKGFWVNESVRLAV